MVGVRYRRALFPGFSDRAEFAFSCPASMVAPREEAGADPPEQADPGAPLDQQVEFAVPPGRITSLNVSAKLMYRKADQFLLNFLFGEESGITAPVTVMSVDEKTIQVRST